MTMPTAPTMIFNPGFQPSTAIDTLENTFGPVACDVGEILYTYQDGVWNPDADNTIRRWLFTLVGNAYKPAQASTVLEILRAREPHIDDSPQDQYLNLPNGLLDWRTGVLTDHTPAVPSTVRIPVAWDPAARCPEIQAWMANVFPADCQEMVEEVIGLCLLDANPFHKAILLSGSGRNGKGTFVRLLTRLLGTDNVCSVNPQTLDRDRFAAAELRGKLANLAGDVDARRFVGTEMFKQVTGGDRLKAERKYGQPFYFTSRALMIAAFNEMPSTSDLSEGYFSRWVILPMTGYFPAGTADETIEERMALELPGLLALGVRGLQRLMARGHFGKPMSVAMAEDAYREESNELLAWLRSGESPVDDGVRVGRSELYSSFVSYAMRSGLQPWTARKVYARIQADVKFVGLKATPFKSNGARGFDFEALELPSDED